MIGLVDTQDYLVDTQDYVAFSGLLHILGLYSWGVAPGCIKGCLSDRALRKLLPSLAAIFCLRIGSPWTISTRSTACDSPFPLLSGEGSVHNFCSALVSKREGALSR